MCRYYSKIPNIVLWTLLIICGFSALPNNAFAQENITSLLLDVPAPPAINPNFPSGPPPREADFYDYKNPPPDYAPIDDLLEYWAYHNKSNPESSFVVIPTDTVIHRLLAECAKNPQLINNYLKVFQRVPDSFARIRQLYETELQKPESEQNYSLRRVGSWLSEYSDLEIDKLEAAANTIADTKSYLTNQDALLRLARIDWDRAEPIAKRLAENSNAPFSQTLGQWVLYRHAYDEGDSLAEDSYRSLLIKTIEDKTAKPGNRDLALDAISKVGDYSGRNDWYIGLLEDETLAELRVDGVLYTGLTTMINHAPPDRFVEIMIELAGGKNKTVRNAAARNLSTLLDNDDPRVVAALLPWLADKNWAREVSGERKMLVRALRKHKVPASVPGLIAMIDEEAVVETDEDDDDIVYGDDNFNSDYGSNTAVKDSSDDLVDSAANGAREAAKDAVNKIKSVRDKYPFREEAVRALIKQEDIRAVSALRRALTEATPYMRDEIVEAIYRSGGYSDTEQVTALETRARTETEETKNRIEGEKQRIEDLKTSFAVPDTNFDKSDVAEPGMPTLLMGKLAMGRGRSKYGFDVKDWAGDKASDSFDSYAIPYLLAGAVIGNDSPKAPFLRAMIDRIRRLEKSEPFVAEGMRGYLRNWGGSAVNALMLDELRAGRATREMIIQLLTRRKEIRETQIELVFDVRNSASPEATGIAACLLEDETAYAAVLAGQNNRAKQTLFACARLIRAKLNVARSAESLNSNDRVLTLAASKYLVSEDSFEAQELLYASAPDKAWILGSRKYFGFESAGYRNTDLLEPLFISTGLSPAAVDSDYFWNSGDHDEIELRLRKEVLSKNDLIGIYWYDNNFVHLYEGRTEFSWEEDPARYKTRTLSVQETEAVNRFLINANLADVPAFVRKCDGCTQKELITLGRIGGRRVFFSSDEPIPLSQQLDELFENLRRPPAKLRYRLEDNIAGVSVLFAHDTLEALRIWNNGNKPVVMIGDPKIKLETGEELRRLFRAEMESDDISYTESIERNARRASEMYKHSYTWYQLKDNALGQQTTQPVDFDNYPEVEGGLPSYLSESLVRSGNGYLYAGSDGLFFAAELNDDPPTLLQEGRFSSLVANNTGTVALFVTYTDETRDLLRLDVAKNRTRKITFPDNDVVTPIKFLKKSSLFLASGASGKIYLIDPTASKITVADGEIQPLVDYNEGGLQKAPNGEYWASIGLGGKRGTRIGRYNLATLKFTEIAVVPDIEFKNGQFWIDENTLDAIIVYNKQLIRVPLKAKAKPGESAKEASEPLS